MTEQNSDGAQSAHDRFVDAQLRTPNPVLSSSTSFNVKPILPSSKNSSPSTAGGTSSFATSSYHYRLPSSIPPPLQPYSPSQPLQQVSPQPSDPTTMSSSAGYSHAYPTRTTFYHYNGNETIKVAASSANAKTSTPHKSFSHRIIKPSTASQPATSTNISSSSSDRPYACTFPNCTWSFTRISDLRRHAKSHAEPRYHCPYYINDPTCHRNGGAFNRLDVLKRHLKLMHYVQDKPQLQHIPQSYPTEEDPGWCRVCQKMFPNSKVFVNHCDACASSAIPPQWKLMKNDEALHAAKESIDGQMDQGPQTSVASKDLASSKAANKPGDGSDESNVFGASLSDLIDDNVTRTQVDSLINSENIPESNNI